MSKVSTDPTAHGAVSIPKPVSFKILLLLLLLIVNVCKELYILIYIFKGLLFGQVRTDFQAVGKICPAFNPISSSYSTFFFKYY